jgi:hypothetical protein
VLHLQLIIFLVGDDVPVDSETLLMIDFVNLMIKSAQSFGCTYRGRVCVYIYMGDCSYVYEYMRLYCISKKNYTLPSHTTVIGYKLRKKLKCNC